MLAALLGLSTQLGKVTLPGFVGKKPGATSQRARAGREKIELSILNNENRKGPLAGEPGQGCAEKPQLLPPSSHTARGDLPSPNQRCGGGEKKHPAPAGEGLGAGRGKGTG